MPSEGDQILSDVREREWGPFIDGEFVDTNRIETTLITNPATGLSITAVPDGTPEDVNRAIDAASGAFEEWRWMDERKRGERLFAVADAIEACEDELTTIECLENGKPLWQARLDVRNAVQRFRYFAGATDKFHGDTVTHSPEQVRTKVYEPYGTVGIVIPWNWPAIHTGDFLSVTLATGNTAVLKPAPSTPLTSLRIAELMNESLPDGVINVVPGGVEPGKALTSNPDVDKIAFTGSDKNGAAVLRSAAENITPVMAELGGKNPAIVFPDAAVETSAQTVVANSFFNSGQACTNPERLLLHTNVYDEFLERIAAQVADLTVGNGIEEDVEIGPQATTGQVQKFHEYVDIAKTEGATVYEQASLPDDPALEDGNFVPPTVLTNVDPQMRIAQEEVFGPVIAVIEFEDESEAIEIANGTEYGLSAAVYTTDLARAHRVASRIKAGIVGVNHPSIAWQGLPFGGYGKSGMGRKNDFKEAMHEFVQAKSIEIDMGEEPLSL